VVPRNVTWRRWSLWTLAAAVPLGCAAFLLARWRGPKLDDFEDWWRQREHLRTNGHHAAESGGTARRDDLFV